MFRCNFRALYHSRCPHNCENGELFCSIHIDSCQYVYSNDNRQITCMGRIMYEKYCSQHDDTCRYVSPNGNKCTNYSGSEQHCSQHDTKEHCGY